MLEKKHTEQNNNRFYGKRDKTLYSQWNNTEIGLIVVYLCVHLWWCK